jgi:hypothetical protein
MWPHVTPNISAPPAPLLGLAAAVACSHMWPHVTACGVTCWGPCGGCFGAKSTIWQPWGLGLQTLARLISPSCPSCPAAAVCQPLVGDEGRALQAGAGHPSRV